MTRVAWQMLARLLAFAAALGFVAAWSTVSAQTGSGRFDRAALDAILAPIALYPDPLLSHVLMAATYPQEVDEAARWSRARPGLTGDAAVRTSEEWDWDPSVRSLLAFPLVLDTMATHMRWTEDLGIAFLEQREDVMDAVQALRRRAYDAGTLRSNESVRVVDTGYGIVIEPAAAQSVHVPYYDPRQSYGTWWWPSRPPVYWSRWPGYVDSPGRGHSVLWGPGTRISSGFFFGGFVWPRREVRVVHVNNYYYHPRRVVIDHPNEPGHHAREPVARREAAPGVWRHDDSRRRPDLRESRRDNEQRFRSRERRESPAQAEARVRPGPGRAAVPTTEPRAPLAPGRAAPGSAESRQQRTLERPDTNPDGDDNTRAGARGDRREQARPAEPRERVDAGARAQGSRGGGGERGGRSASRPDRSGD